MKTILVAIDLPPTKGSTLDTAIPLAQALGARLVVLHVIRPPTGAGDEQPNQGYAAAQSEQTALHLTRLQRNLQRRSVTIETRHMMGRPAQCICELASVLMATYVVVGAHDRGPLTSSFLGGTTSEVLRAAPCPVVVVRSAVQARPCSAGDGPP